MLSFLLPFLGGSLSPAVNDPREDEDEFFTIIKLEGVV